MTARAAPLLPHDGFRMTDGDVVRIAVQRRAGEQRASLAGESAVDPRLIREQLLDLGPPTPGRGRPRRDELCGRLLRGQLGRERHRRFPGMASVDGLHGVAQRGVSGYRTLELVVGLPRDLTAGGGLAA
jgi:hypothetical protein